MGLDVYLKRFDDFDAIQAREKEADEFSQRAWKDAGDYNKLTQEEILDLVAYVYARGDKKHHFYDAEHKH